MIKKKIFLTILIISILIAFFTYQKIFKNEENEIKEVKEVKEENSVSENSSNLIKNLKYNVSFENNTSYSITAFESEIIYENNIEIIQMKDVEAIFISSDNKILKITSKNAKYNNSSYNTEFENQIRIEYLENIITSEKLFLNFEENVVIISDNIVYEGLKGMGKADVIKIDLISKNIEISMSNLEKKIEIISK